MPPVRTQAVIGTSRHRQGFSYLDPTEDLLVFHGRDGTEAEEFIYAVRQRAFTAGETRNNRWLVDLAAACFVGDALRWHMSLEKEVREDWDRLCVALLAKYPSIRAVNNPAVAVPRPFDARAALATLQRNLDNLAASRASAGPSNSNPRSMMQIFVKTLTGKTVTLFVNPYDTLSRVKTRLQLKQGAELHGEHRFKTMNGREMKNGRTLFYYNVQKEQTISLMKKAPCPGCGVCDAEMERD